MELCWPFQLSDCPVSTDPTWDPSDEPSSGLPCLPLAKDPTLQAAELTGPRECDADPYPLLSEFLAAQLHPEKRAHLPTINNSMSKAQREEFVCSHLSPRV